MSSSAWDGDSSTSAAVLPASASPVYPTRASSEWSHHRGTRDGPCSEGVNAKAGQRRWIHEVVVVGVLYARARAIHHLLTGKDDKHHGSTTSMVGVRPAQSASDLH